MKSNAAIVVERRHHQPPLEALVTQLRNAWLVALASMADRVEAAQFGPIPQTVVGCHTGARC
ncbi:MAG: hypothetical protein ABIW50_09095 [Candidatus Limnocylindria bacterium]